MRSKVCAMPTLSNNNDELTNLCKLAHIMQFNLFRVLNSLSRLDRRTLSTGGIRAADFTRYTFFCICSRLMPVCRCATTHTHASRTRIYTLYLKSVRRMISNANDINFKFIFQLSFHIWIHICIVFQITDSAHKFTLAQAHIHRSSTT